jgi:hypothetical protein
MTAGIDPILGEQAMVEQRERTAKFTRGFLPKEDARAIICGLIPDGLNVEHLTPKARQEIRAALDRVLDLSK